MLSFYPYISHLDTKKSELVKRFGHEIFFYCIFFHFHYNLLNPNIRNLNKIIKVLLCNNLTKVATFYLIVM
jgi:hypothetical protein